MKGPLSTAFVGNVFTWMIIMVVVLSSLKMDVIAFSFSSSLSTSSDPLINERSINDNDPPSSSLMPPLLRTSTTATTTKQSNNTYTTMHLISLPPIDDTYTSPISESLIRECWRWKDVTLGDGRDYFLPKPRALKDFHSLFVGMEISIITNTNNEEVIVKPPSSSMSRESFNYHSKTRLSLHNVDEDSIVNNNDNDIDGGGGTTPTDNNGCVVENSSVQRSFIKEEQQRFVIEECVALSNCARLDVILVLKREQKQQQQWLNEDMTDSSLAARYAVAYNLQQQVQSRQSNNNSKSSSSSLLDRIGLTTLLDLPGAVRKNNNDEETETFSTNDDNGQCSNADNEIRQLANRLSTMEGARAICTHLSLVASGLSPRPNRPDREVLFRPYSSRDAHILLQLKRTVELVSVLNMTTTTTENGGGGGGRGRIKTILDCALTAGKASRNERIVPDIRKLKEYGSNGTPPLALAKVVAEVRLYL
jgi:hypothetical protein